MASLLMNLIRSPVPFHQVRKREWCGMTTNLVKICSLNVLISILSCPSTATSKVQNPRHHGFASFTCPLSSLSFQRVHLHMRVAASRTAMSAPECYSEAMVRQTITRSIA